MKRVWIVLVAVLAISVASAQGRLFGEALGGELSLVPGFGLSLGVAAGAERLLGPLDVRGGITIGAAGALPALASSLTCSTRFGPLTSRSTWAAGSAWLRGGYRFRIARDRWPRVPYRELFLCSYRIAAWG